MNRAFIILLFALPFTICLSQEKFGTNIVTAKQIKLDQPVSQKFDFGIGIGLDYGGVVGIKFSYTPLKHLGMFVSLGYHSVTLGWQVGLAGYILPKLGKHAFRPYGKVMFGSNRTIKIDGAPRYDKIYYGITPGIGIEIRVGRYQKHGINVDINYPVNSSKFNKDLDYLKNNTSLAIKNYSPVTISLGYHFILLY